MVWGAPTQNGNPPPRQQPTISKPQQSQPLHLLYQSTIFKPQPAFQTLSQQTQYVQPQQPPPQQYQYQEVDHGYDEEDEGWIPPQQQQQQWNRGRGPPRRMQQPQGQAGYNNDHYNAIANANTPRNTNKNIFRLRLFPFTLKDKAKYWFTSLQSNSITTWEQLKAKFLQEFYPASKTTEIRRAIQDFWQKPREAFHEAWDRLKELMCSCPHHDIPKWKPVSTAAAVGADTDWKKEVKKEISELNKKFDRPYNQGSQNFNNQRQNNYQGQSSNQPRQFQPANNGNSNGSSSSNNNNNKGAANNNNAPGSQEDMTAKMYEMFNATQQQSQANAKAIANMERQIGQMAEDQRKRDNNRLPSTTKINPNHTQWAGKEHVNAVEAEWRKVTVEDLLGYEDEVEVEGKGENEEEVKAKEEKDKDEEKIQVEKETKIKEDKEA
ncbi:hypothetical protein L2E82_35921 [Cichorium intybus]|uniref:Uncharacterized protein n=1 Tax=Cichorium intybus TaxID=13427 RepID=A0ACB9BQ39_CICIN|nr:hypothetical protein L2E82_35921 [Cichorium intybus]